MHKRQRCLVEDIVQSQKGAHLDCVEASRLHQILKENLCNVVIDVCAAAFGDVLLICLADGSPSMAKDLNGWFDWKELAGASHDGAK